MNAPGAKRSSALPTLNCSRPPCIKRAVAGKPRLTGARAALEALGVTDAGGKPSRMPSASRSGLRR